MKMQCIVKVVYYHHETVHGFDEGDCIQQAEDAACDALGGIDSSDVECETMVQEVDDS